MGRNAKFIAVVVVMIATSGMRWNPAIATATTPTAVVPYGAGGYRYQQVPSGGGAAIFSDVGFDDSAFNVGNAPFGQTVPAFGCPLTPSTPWSPNTDLLVRRAVSLPAGTTDVVIHAAIDNDIELFWNGTPVGANHHEGCAARDSVEVAVPSAVLTAGDNILAVRASDHGGESLLDLEVTANLPPNCASVTTDQTTLWPPNHSLRVVTAQGGADPEGEPVSLAIVAVTQDEPLDGTGDGNSAPDADNSGLPANQVRLRAERLGNSDGRVYRVAVRATDASGASCSTTIAIGVPHDQRTNASAVDTTAVVVDSFGSDPSLSGIRTDAPSLSVGDLDPSIEVRTTAASPQQPPVNPHVDDAATPVVVAPVTTAPAQPSASPALPVPSLPPAPDSPTAPSTLTTEEEHEKPGATAQHKPTTPPRALRASG